MFGDEFADKDNVVFSDETVAVGQWRLHASQITCNPFGTQAKNQKPWRSTSLPEVIPEFMQAYRWDTIKEETT
jgi:hypothetical protein